MSAVGEIGAPVLEERARGVTQFRLNVILSPILLNFYATQRESTISSVLPSISRLAQEALTTERKYDTRLTGMQLQIALNELAQTLAERVVKADPEDTPAVFQAFQARND